ncbi:4-hydroxythreonine-4-phosphate dehydrogenase PdxA [Paracidovorax citrulli]|uniref:4-hydroxythreonine-4-phosphate dehydrogenase n=2 Tax=Paracidovorax citrulli TaxID=80869 RepID=A1TTF8_PARC0|nr:4-hydroxythreonine-4-phosphate dehydrogenase PdxA [Paracidovorax citrulli]ABM34246.1 4-hydroxythreonine-4-phosphate dehydrogenase [Paracidovorax citrulli AAC00-1]ATG93742.1 4-hydroxythreonine-4-phosphate dehydrogenase PdxA [Paracidovorax citrulli]PVY63690.1 4-hydroxythreonine-4-phosphate dehydrogenase [Paracidovorax citrulli]QCX09672.1 4-hydroxythreonine-4-phosphate dehydrogenase 2 [Paracidovorax citrulli]REG67346.1 4-hydroxythreonine-4-phosphate dehydrogenase [Paracidovorax citrulli]
MQREATVDHRAAPSASAPAAPAGGLPLLAVTQGDPAGIGPEIIAKAFRDAPDAMRGCFVVGGVETLRRAARCIARPGEPSLPLALLQAPEEARAVPPRCVPLLPLPGLPGSIPFGAVHAEGGRAAADCVTWAARAALRGEIAGLVTAPLHKEALSAAGVHHPGHTELLQAEAARHAGVPVADMPVRMMLASDELRTVLVSIHVSLREAIAAVTQDNVLRTLEITHAALRRGLGRGPRIGVAGLNPHAGEGGLFGREEIEAIAPAIAAARALGIDAHGPFAPDTVFMRARSTPQRPGEFDVVLAMYHDQGLIPVKYLGVDKGVNVTLGLPLVRTSPDHGTAFDIAGRGVADASSLVEAVLAARRLAGPVPGAVSA